MSRTVSHSSVRNSGWSVHRRDDGLFDHEQVNRAILLDIREELRLIREYMCTVHVRLNCHETLQIPATLKAIKRNTTRRKPRRKTIKE